jgi:hypothetical protein
VKLSL